MSRDTRDGDGAGATYEDIEAFADEQLHKFVAGFQPKHLAAMIEAGRAAGWVPPAVNVSFRNLFYKRGGDVLLNGVSGYIRSGEVLAVMGPGATTFFEVLANRQRGGRVSGEVLVDHRPPDESFDRVVGYVTKEDNHLPLLTVRETIMLSINLRTDAEMPLIIKRLRAELAMKMLGIAHVADSVVGDGNIRGISGGEKRRLSIALEIVAGHSVILADLPTNGLDSATSLSILRNTRQAARAGNAVAYSIVQASPELYEQFDNVLCLCRNSAVFFGPPAEAVAFFERCGFRRPHGKSYPDFVTEVLDTPERFFEGDPLPPAAGISVEAPPQSSSSKQLKSADAQPQERRDGNGGKNEGGRRPVTYREAWEVMRGAYERSDEYARLGDTLWKDLRPQFETREQAPPPRFVSPWTVQALTVLVRQVQITYRNKPAFVGGIMRSIIMGTLLGTLFFDLGESSADARARMGLLFFCMIFPVTSAFQAVPNYVAERRVFYTQTKASYYRKVLFWLASEGASLPFVFAETTIYAALVYGMAGLRGGVFGSEFWFFLLIIYVTGLTARGYVFAVSMAAPDVAPAQAIVPVFFVLFMLISGFLIPRESISPGWRWFNSCSFITYTIRSIAINEFTGLDFVCEGAAAAGDPPCFGFIPAGSAFPGSVVLQFYDMDADSDSYKWELFGFVILFFLIFNAAAVAASLLVDWSGTVDAEKRHDGATAPGAGPGGLDDKASRTSMPPGAHGAVRVDVHDGGAAGGRQDNAGVVEFRNLCYDVPVKNPTPEDGRGKTVQRRLLTNVSGYAVPGRMIALMGASGAGKSTLLDLLANKKTGGTLSGDLLVNGRPRDEYFSRFTGYVEQFDSHDGNATVREAVEFSARLRLPADTPERELQQAVSRVLDELDLTPVADSLIGSPETGDGLSPELRKKVTIAVELVMSPGILFLDEPSTGLSSASAVAVMEATRRLADRISVICTIHQPSNEIVNMFDWMLLLQPGGRVVYFGPVDELGDYFERNGFGRPPLGANIADYALEALKARSEAVKRGEDGAEDPADVFERSPQFAQSAEALEKGVAKAANLGEGAQTAYDSRFAASWGVQFWVLLQRFVRSDARERVGIYVRTLNSLVLGLVVGTIYLGLASPENALANNNRVSVCFFFVSDIFFSSQAIIGKHAAFRQVYFRETTNSMYSSGSFYLARFVADVPLQLAGAFIFTVIVYWLTDVVPVDQVPRFGLFLACAQLSSMVAYAFTETLAALGPTAEVGTALSGFFTTIFMLFTGFLATREIIPDAYIWLYYANPMRYPLFYLLQLSLNTGTTTAEATMDAFDVNPDDAGFYFGMTLLFLFVFRLSAYLANRFVSHVKR
jgi:ABC-type multidrug transport system ATPase subunit/ABC-type multidrug transport system permease subunit